MESVCKVFLVSTLFALVIQIECNGAASAEGPEVEEGITGGDALKNQSPATSSPSSTSELQPLSAFNSTSPPTPSPATTSASSPSSTSELQPLSAFNSTSPPIPSPASTSASSPSSTSEPCSSLPPTIDPERAQALGEQLHGAVRSRSLEEAERLLDAGADPNYAPENGFTPLMSASWMGHAPMVSLLLRRGASVRAFGRDGATALHVAAANDRSGRCVELLAAAGAPLLWKADRGWSPLHVAAHGDNEAAARALVAAGASKLARDRSGRMPVEYARRDAVRRLLRPWPSYALNRGLPVVFR